MTSNRRVIILGANGFIGAYLVSWLRSHEYYVVGIDKTDYFDQTLGLKKANIFYQLSLPDQRFEDILRKISPDVVINVSGPASVANSLIEPATDFNGSVNLCFFVLESIRKSAPGCSFLMTSSAAVYGNTAVLPVKESALLNPISPYGYHKMICEILAKEYYSIYGIQTSAVRIFSAYGPGLRKQILWDIYQKATRSKQVSLFGSGEETRDFVFVEDIAQAIQLVLERGCFNGNSYNIGSGNEVSIKKLAQLLLSSLDMEDVELAFLGERKPGDPLKWCADIDQIKNLGFSPHTNLDQGVLNYAKWAKELKEIN